MTTTLKSCCWFFSFDGIMMLRMINGKRSLLLLFIVLVLCAGSSSCDNQLDTNNSGKVIEEPPSEQFKQKYMTYADEIPVMHINTANGGAITSKTDYVNATINIGEYFKKD